MNIFRKKISWFGLFVALTMPVGAIMSCGNEKKVNKFVFPIPDIENAKEIDLHDVDLSAFKEAALEKGITKEQVDSITFKDIQMYRLKQKIDPKKKELIDSLDNLILKFAFSKNLDSAVMGELQKWLNNASLQVYNVQGSGGPWRSQEEQGNISYYRNDLLKIRRPSKLSGGEIDLIGSRFVEGSGYNSERFIRSFGATRKPKKGDRPFDLSLAIYNNFSGIFGVSSSFSFYRTRGVGDYKYTIDGSTGIKTWDSVMEEKTNLYDGLKVKINGHEPETSSYDSIVNLAENANENTEIVFENKEDKVVKYAKAKNGDVVETDSVFKAKDLFYGFLRNLYASKSVRNEGKINGIDITEYLKPFTENQNARWADLFENQNAADAYDNGNTYIFDLYGIDIKKTIEANMKSKDENKFIIKFNNFAPTSLEFFRDNNSINPFSKTILRDDVKNISEINSFDPDKLSVFSYGKPYSGGKISPDGFLSIAPFIYTNYSITPGEYITIKQNTSYVDQDWVKNPLSIKGYKNEIIKDNSDASSHASARLKSFKEANVTQEYLLDQSILSMKSLLKEVETYKSFVKPVRRGMIGNVYSWNFYGFDHHSYNDLGRKMMWGIDKNIGTTPSAMKEFFYGSGAKTRASINAAVNWHAMVQTLFPGLNKEFYPSISLDDEFATSKVDKRLAFPKHMQTTDQLKNIYDSNVQDLYKAWTPATVSSAAKTLDNLATKVGATKENPAQIGINRTLFVDKPKTQQEIQASEIILGRLNSLTEKVKFVNQDEKYTSYDDFYSLARRKKTHATLLHGYSADYLGLGSINQQYLTYYCTFGAVPFFKAAFENE